MSQPLALPPPPAWCGPIHQLSPKAVTNVSIIAVLSAIYIPMVLLRFYVRARILKALWWDDAAIAVAFLLILPIDGMSWYSNYIGLGKHIVCVNNLDYISQILHLTFTNQVVVALSLIFSRLSVALFVIRIFALSRTLKVVLYSFAISTAIITLVGAVAVFPQCHPVEKLWKPWLPGKCWTLEQDLAPAYLNGATSTFSDFILALLPIYFLWPLNMPLKRKISIMILMGLGLLTAACAMARTILLRDIGNPDVTYALANVGIFSYVECSVAIIAATAPTLRPLFSKDARGGSSSRGSSRRNLFSFSKGSKASSANKGSDTSGSSGNRTVGSGLPWLHDTDSDQKMSYRTAGSGGSKFGASAGYWELEEQEKRVGRENDGDNNNSNNNDHNIYRVASGRSDQQVDVESGRTPAAGLLHQTNAP